MGIQDQYERDHSSVLGGTVALREFKTKEEKEAATAKLKELGFNISQVLNNVDAVVVPDAPSSALRVNAQNKGLTIMNMAEVEELAGLQSLDTTTLDDELGREIEYVDAYEITEDYVRILDVKLPVRKNADPSLQIKHPKKFSFLCLDEQFMITARNVAAAAAFDIPCSLEGETATAKTTIIRFVAALAGQPVYRLNLNGQTDTSELVGRYVPASGHVEIDTQILLDNMGEFDQGEDWARVRKDLQELKEAREQSESAEMNEVEKARLAKTLGLAAKSWEFMEGYIPKALRKGVWVILDEMNLAEPQVLERLNSVLEDGHELVLTEGEGTIFAKGGDVEPHEDFRLFGTMNPAEYAGRSTLSPAYRDRWQMWRFVDLPNEASLHAMLRKLVFGEQPGFQYKGVFYKATESSATYPELQKIDGIDSLLERLAAFHFSVSCAAGMDGQAQIGRTRRERYVFTRRGLLAVMKLLNRAVTKGAADLSVILEDVLTLMYVERIQDHNDRAVVYNALRASGLVEG